MSKSITEQFEEIKTEVCDKLCKYPTMPVPEGKSEDWLIEDEDSPCMRCPLNRL